MNWHPIETAPKDGTWILIYAPHDLYPTVDGTHWIVRWEVVRGVGGWFDQGQALVLYTDEPTHWMHLPDAPVKPSVGQVHPNDKL